MIEILKIIVPALLVMLTAVFVLTKMLKNEEKKHLYQLKKNGEDITLPLRLRAYERLTLLLERSAPNALIVAAVKPEMNCMELQNILLETIRKEFSHNVSQQIYVSNQLWKALKTTEESLVRLINTCASKVNAQDNALKLAELVIKVYASAEVTPSEMALALLKNEARGLF
jgi:hypothetical protein